MHCSKQLLFLLLTFCATAVIAAHAMGDDLKEWETLSQESMNPDMAYSFSAKAKTNGQFDRNADGRIDLIIADRNGDGKGDYWATDRNFDGRIDDYQYDRNLDGRIDQWEYDIDHDGVSDKIYVDADGDGKAEMYASLNPITRTYTWYGNMNSIQGAAQVAFPPLTFQKKYKGGKIGDSF